MKKIFCFLLILGAGIFVSCRTLLLPNPEFTKSAPSFQPVEKLFKLSKEKFIFNPIVDTSSIYVAQLDMSPEPTAYFLLRFSNKGVCYILDNHNINFNVLDYNTFSNGQFGRYIVEKGNILKLEFYHHGYRFFIYWYGKIDEEKIHFIMQKKTSKLSVKNRIAEQDYIYYKQKAKLTEKLVFPK